MPEYADEIAAACQRGSEAETVRRSRIWSREKVQSLYEEAKAAREGLQDAMDRLDAIERQIADLRMESQQ